MNFLAPHTRVAIGAAIAIWASGMALVYNPAQAGIISLPAKCHTIAECQTLPDWAGEGDVSYGSYFPFSIKQIVDFKFHIEVLFDTFAEIAGGIGRFASALPCDGSRISGQAGVVRGDSAWYDTINMAHRDEQPVTARAGACSQENPSLRTLTDIRLWGNPIDPIKTTLAAPTNLVVTSNPVSVAEPSTLGLLGLGLIGLVGGLRKRGDV